LPGKRLSTIRKKFSKLRNKVFNKWNYKLFGLGAATFLSSLLPLKTIADTYFSFHTQPKTVSVATEYKKGGSSFLVIPYFIMSQERGPAGSIHFKDKLIEISGELGFASGEHQTQYNNNGNEYWQSDTTLDRMNSSHSHIGISYNPNLGLENRVGNISIRYVMDNRSNKDNVDSRTHYTEISSDTTQDQGYTVINNDTINVATNVVSQVTNSQQTYGLMFDFDKNFGEKGLNYGMLLHLLKSNIHSITDLFSSTAYDGNINVNNTIYDYHSSSSFTGHNELSNGKNIWDITPYVDFSMIHNINGYPFVFELGLEKPFGEGRAYESTVTSFIAGNNSYGYNYTVAGELMTGKNSKRSLEIKLLKPEKENIPESVKAYDKHRQEIKLAHDITLTDKQREFYLRSLNEDFSRSLSGISYGLSIMNDPAYTTVSADVGKYYNDILNSYSATVGVGLAYNKGDGIKPVFGISGSRNNWSASTSFGPDGYNLELRYKQ